RIKRSRLRTGATSWRQARSSRAGPAKSSWSQRTSRKTTWGCSPRRNGGRGFRGRAFVYLATERCFRQFFRKTLLLRKVFRGANPAERIVQRRSTELRPLSAPRRGNRDGSLLDYCPGGR